MKAVDNLPPTIKEFNCTIYINGKRIVIGKVKNGVFSKTIYGSKHIMRKFNAIGFDYGLMKETIIPCCHEIRVTDKETGIVYSCNPAIVGKVEDGKLIPNESFSEIRHYKREGWDDRVQIFIPLIYFSKK